MPKAPGVSQWNAKHFRGGLNTLDDPETMAETDLQEATNLYVEEAGIAKKRLGVAQRFLYRSGSAPPQSNFNSVHEYRRAESAIQLLAFAGAELRVLDEAFVLAVGVSQPTFAWTNDIVESVQALDNAYLFNGVDAVQRWNGTALFAAGLAASVNATTPTLQAGGSLPDGTYSYAYTYRYGSLGESNLSSVSADTTTNSGAGNSKISLSIPNTTPATADVTHKRIYRKDGASSSTAPYLFLAEVTYATTTYVDDGSVTKSTTAPPLIVRQAPPTGRFAVYHNDRMFVAGVGANRNTLYYSDLSLPDAFEAANTIPVSTNDGDIITGLVSWNDSLYIFKQRRKFVLTGYGPSQWRLRPLTDYGTSHFRTLVKTDAGILFLSPQPPQVYLWNGVKDVPLGKKILPTLQSIPQNFLPNLAAVSTTQDWAAGYLDNSLNTDYPPDPTDSSASFGKSEIGFEESGIDLQASDAAGRWIQTNGLQSGPVGTNFDDPHSGGDVNTTIELAGNVAKKAGDIQTFNSFFIQGASTDIPDNGFEDAVSPWGSESQGGSGGGIAIGTIDSARSALFGGIGADTGIRFGLISFIDNNSGVISGVILPTVQLKVFLRDPATNQRLGGSISIPLSPGAPVQNYTTYVTSSLAAFKGQKVRLEFWFGDGGSTGSKDGIGTGSNYGYSILSPSFICDGGTISYRFAKIGKAPREMGALIDTILGGALDYSGGGNLISAQIQGQGPDVNRTWAKVTITGWKPAGTSLAMTVFSYPASGTVYGAAVAVTLSTATDPSTGRTIWTGWCAVEPDVYLKYKVTLTGSAPSTSVISQTPIVEDLRIDYFGHKNYWFSPPFNLGGTPTSWGVFQATTYQRNLVNAAMTRFFLPGGLPTDLTCTFYMRTAASVSALNGVAWTAIAVGSAPGLTLNPVVQFAVLLDSTDWFGDNVAGKMTVPFVDDFLLPIYFGVVATPPTAIWWKRRYWLSVETDSTSARNDQVLVLGRELQFSSGFSGMPGDIPPWTKFTGLDVSHFAVFRQRLVSGRNQNTQVPPAGANDKWAAIEEHDTGNDDRTQPIDFRLHTKELDFGSPSLVKDLRDAQFVVKSIQHLAFPGGSQPSNVVTQTFFEGKAGPSASTVIPSADPFRAPFTHAPMRGRTLSIFLENNEAGNDLDLLALSIDARIQERVR